MSWAEKKRSPPPSPITSLPEDVVVDILARVPVCDYPRVSLVSKRFRSLVSSPEIYSYTRDDLRWAALSIVSMLSFATGTTV
ncbi:hypothetical protein F2Q69_00062589 [Brassica cretica]|uniref:F-box domain-containing protein n=2 Tax=Brassica TaxID=3705 RepID=A0A8S9RG49_BRACR|nr:hypothetical protein F2Q69_00062589 [Brassica cretica]VDD58183.1 unnamed protein product [Brassica oleracea]